MDFSVKLMRSLFAMIAGLVIALTGGCGVRDGDAEASIIKTNYVRFRDAVMSRDVSTAKRYVTKEISANVMAAATPESFWGFPELHTALEKDAWVRFERGGVAWLHPQGKAAGVGTSGWACEFVKTTNGWLITGKSELWLD
jgi:hypothetical protein